MFTQVEVPSKLQRGVQQRCGELRRPAPSQDLPRGQTNSTAKWTQTSGLQEEEAIAILKMEGI